MRKINLTEDVARALDQLFQWAKCEASSSVVYPVWQIVLRAIEEEKVQNDEKEIT